MAAPRRARCQTQGPRIVDDIPDVDDHPGREWRIDEFVVVGWSGGGPRALACAAMLPNRCRAAATLAGLAPFDAEGLDWMTGMGPGNVADFTAALEGPDGVRRVPGNVLPAHDSCQRGRGRGGPGWLC